MKHESISDVALATVKDGRLSIALIIARMGVSHMNRHEEVPHKFRVQDVGEGSHQLVAELFQVDIESRIWLVADEGDLLNLVGDKIALFHHLGGEMSRSRMSPAMFDSPPTCARLSLAPDTPRA